MSASTTDKVTDVRNGARPNSARVTVARNVAATSLSCDNLTGWPTASKVHFVTYQIDTNSNPVAGTQLDCSGIVSGNTITSLSVIDGTDGGNAIGDVVEMLPTAAWGQDLSDAITSQHSRTGAHVGINNTAGLTNAGGLTTDSLTVSGAATLGTPTISSFANAQHDHSNAANGGTLPAASVATNLIASATTGSDTNASGTYKIAPLTLTATLLARPVKITASVNFGQRTSATATAGRVKVKEGTTLIAEGVGAINGSAAATNENRPVAIAIFTPTAGSHTYDVYVEMADGSNMSTNTGLSFMEYI